MILQPIITGGTGGSQPAGTHKVIFIDYDGTILKTQYVANGGTAIAPTIPVLTGLTFQQWNCPLTNIQEDRVIGVVRKTSDNITKLFVTIQANATDTLPIVSIDNIGGGVVEVDFGDGSPTQGSNQSGVITFMADYPYNPEDPNNNYVISISSTANYKLGDGVDAVIQSTGYILTKALLSSQVVGLNSYAFYNTNIETVNIPQECVSIGSRAFTGLVGSDTVGTPLKAIVVPSSITILDSMTFQSCLDLESVSCSNNLIDLGSYVFYNCKSLKNLYLGNSLQTISYLAFVGVQLDKLVLPNTVNSLTDSSGGGVFESTIIKELVLPDAITVINRYEFRYSSGTKFITLGNNITGVRDYAFRNCFGLSSLSFPVSLNASSLGISVGAFQQCNIRDFYFYSTTPTPLASGAFGTLNPLCLIHVPAASLSAYQNAINWNAYTNYIIGDL